jgi:HSP20 family protein
MTDQELRTSEKKELAPESGEFTREGVYFSPAVDIYGTEQELVILADMPGVNPDDMDIDLRDDTLTIVGRITEGELEGEALLTEYNLGNYFRTFRITELIDQSKIKATMIDGVLKVTLPRADKTMPRKIPITTE